jgi:cell wall-associated NlpC family hydrolase
MPAAGVAAGAALVLATVTIGVTVAGGAASSGAPPGGTALLAGGLRSGVVPDAALIPWVEAAGALCPTFPPSVIAAQAQAESSWIPTVVSPAGAEGIDQFMPATFAIYGADDDATGNVNPFNPPDALMAAGRYDCALATAEATLSASSEIPVLSLALAAYNAGPRAVSDAGGIPPIPATQAYVETVESDAATYVVAAPSTAFGQAVVNAAAAWLGTPYAWGGGTVSGPSGSPAGFDCSGLVLLAVYQASGGAITLPHSSQLQATLGQSVAPADLAPGDVIALALQGPADFDHVVIYAGGGSVIAAPHSGGVVAVQPLSDFAGAPWNIRRFG